jgi:hypothetical protein
MALKVTQLNKEIVAQTMGCFLKDEADIATFKEQMATDQRG